MEPALLQAYVERANTAKTKVEMELYETDLKLKECLQGLYRAGDPTLWTEASSDSEDEDEGGARHNGILFRTADPRYLENPKDPQGGDTILDIGKIRELLHMNSTLADSAGEV